MPDNLRPQGWAPRRFAKYDRVELTKRAQRVISHRVTTGRVVRDQALRSIVTVVLDGQVTPRHFYSGFWRKISGGRKTTRRKGVRALRKQCGTSWGRA